MKRLFFLLAFFLTVSAVPASELDAIAVLQKLDVAKATDAELFGAAAACRELTVLGTEKAVPVLESLLGNPKLDSYARTALENIGKPEAEAALKKHPAKTDNASPVDAKLEKAAAAVKSVLEGGDRGLTEFATMLKSDDRTTFNAALTAFRLYSSKQSPDRKIVDVLAKEQAGLKPERRIAAIYSLLDRKDVSPVPPEIVEAAKSDANAEVQAAAITVIGAFPDENIVDILLSLFKKEKREPLSETLKKTLISMKSSALDDRLISLIRSKDEEDVWVGCLFAGDRHLEKAKDDIWKVIQETDLKDRGVLYGSYGQVADRGGFDKLLEKYRQYPYEKLLEDYTRDASVRSDSLYLFMGLRECCKRSADRNYYAKQLATKLPAAPFQLSLLETLGGSEALKQIAEIAAKTDKDEIRDQATKILGEWTGAEVAPVLLELSDTLTEPKYKVRTLRGFLRAVRQFEMPKEEKKKLCEKALNVATREDEKKMIRDVLSKL